MWKPIATVACRGVKATNFEEKLLERSSWQRAWCWIGNLLVGMWRQFSTAVCIDWNLPESGSEIKHCCPPYWLDCFSLVDRMNLMGCVLDPRYQFEMKSNELLMVSLDLYWQNCILFEQVVYSFLLVSGKQFFMNWILFNREVFLCQRKQKRVCWKVTLFLCRTDHRWAFWLYCSLSRCHERQLGRGLWKLFPNKGSITMTQVVVTVPLTSL